MKRYVRAAWVAATLITVSSVDLGLAQEVVGKSGDGKSGVASAVLSAIRAGSRAFVEAFNKQDAQAVAESWTPDGDYVDELGRRITGRLPVRLTNPNSKQSNV